jgi:putative membrane protein
MRFLIRLLVTAAALWAAVLLVPGIDYDGHWAGLLGVALVFGVVNAVIRPLLMWLTCPLVVLTLGLFILVLNGLLLWLTGLASGALGLDFRVVGFWPAVIGGLVVGIVAAVLTLFLGDGKRRQARRR